LVRMPTRSVSTASVAPLIMKQSKVRSSP
jgi:hypothetical protein